LLAPAAAAPEATATHGLYERHGDRIHSYCLHQLGSREEAEDAVQTTFMNAFGALRKGVVPESEGAWLFKIAENVCLSRRRSSWRRARIESPADFGVIEEVVAGPDSRRDELIGIENALAAMPTQQRRAILLREWHGLSYREIATEIDVTQAAVETLIFRARRSLARGLEEPETIKPRRERRGLRKARRLGDLASVFMGAKALLGGTAAANAALAVVTVTAVAGVTARPASELVPDTVGAKPAPAVVRGVPTPPASVVPSSVRAAQEAAVRMRVRGGPAVGTPAAVAAERRAARTDPEMPAPARDVGATRSGEAGKPDATPAKPPHAAAPDKPEKPDKPAKPETSAQPERPPRAAVPEKPVKPKPNGPQTRAKQDKPSPTLPAAVGPRIDVPKAQPDGSHRPVSPRRRPADDELPEQAPALAAEPATPPEQAAEPEHGHAKAMPAVSRRS
jgi:RNA polymerase sigma-70 factor (ECF subfamily)